MVPKFINFTEQCKKLLNLFLVGRTKKVAVYSFLEPR